MRSRLLIATAALWLGLAAPAAGQSQDNDAPTATLGQRVVARWRVGMIVTAEGGAFKRIVGTVTVPMDWPEQTVREVERDLSSGVTVSYRTVEGAARQMVVSIPPLAAGDDARAIVTFEIKRLCPSPPENPDLYVLPKVKPADRRLGAFLGPSPLIESDDAQIAGIAKKLVAGQDNAWRQVEALYDWVREKIEFHDNRGGTVKSALQALRDGTGDCDEMTSLFVALCRASDVPARTVRVPGHCYPEFYLLDDEGKGHWFPCQAAGSRAFGAMPDPRPVLQKGDNLLVVDAQTKKKTRARFLPETLAGFPAGRGGALRLKLVCEPADQ